MPRVTISINARGEASDQDLLTLDLPPGLTVKDLKGFIEAETRFPSTSQSLYLNGQVLSNEVQTLEAAGIQDGEMLAVLIRKRQGGQPQNTSDTRPQQPDPEAVRQQVLNDPNARESLRQNSPELFAALQDPNRFRQLYAEMGRRQQEAEREREHQMQLLNADPFNIDAQRRIEEIIRQDRVMDNLQHAYEHNPEVFGRVHMLYINTEVNGHPVKAFVDSGAQATIMSPDCAEKCGISRLIDTRWSGLAKGVGTAKILGRVHSAEINIGGAIMPCAFTVMEGKDVDLLFGLDMLKRHRAKIDLEKNALCFAGIEVPFLAEHEIPKALEDAELNEPTIAGPNGTEIGGRTGVVRPAGSTDGQPGPSSAPSRPAQPPPQQAPKSEAFPAEHIERITSMGFPRQAAIQALQAAGGNLDEAITLLLAST